MARVTIEDCLDHVGNMYELVHLTTRRVRQILRGSEPLVKCKNRVAVTALREIAAGKVKLVKTPGNDNDDDLSNLAN